MTDHRGPAAGPRTAELLEEARLLSSALEHCGAAVADEVTSAARQGLDAVQERLALGVDHTVVALVGGTGSGKSSLFNALSGLDFADVGVRRPTTSEVTACVWAHDATALLDWLGVARDRRIERESALDGETQADLRGLVLLDLPDHDSVEPEHRAVVDRLLPQVDLLVWVVDPQKYADDALHTGYLQRLTGHAASMLVVLNQIDTVPVGAQASVLRDVSRLLREDGLGEVAVHGVSARSGDGVPVLRGALARAVGRRGVAEVRAAAEVEDVRRVLRSAVGQDELGPDDLPRAAAVAGLADALGVDGVVAGARTVDPATPLPGTGLAQPERVTEVRDAWLRTVASGLPERWRSRLERAVPDEDVLLTALEAAAGVPVPVAAARGARVLEVVALVLGVVAVVVGGLGVAGLLGVSLPLEPTVLLVAAGGAAVLGLAGWFVARSWRAAAGRRRADRYASTMVTLLEGVVDERLVRPTGEVLAEHRTLREAARAEERPPG